MCMARLLPKLRGASPMHAAILEGLDESGITIMRMDEGLDTGDMISKVSCDIRGKDINEVSEILAMPAQSSWSRLCRALKTERLYMKNRTTALRLMLK